MRRPGFKSVLSAGRRLWRNVKADTQEPAADVGSQLQAANKLLQSRCFEDAERVLNAALTHHPNHPDLVECLARVAQRDGRWADALGHWENLTLRNPDQLNGWVRRIKILAELKRPEEAADVLRGALERWPSNPKLNEARALALEGEQRWSDALKCWRNLAVTHPSHAASHVGQHIAMCEIKLGRVGEAGRSLEEAVGAREEAAVFERMFGSYAPFIPYYGMRIEEAFRDLAKADGPERRRPRA